MVDYKDKDGIRNSRKENNDFKGEYKTDLGGLGPKELMEKSEVIGNDEEIRD